jgi:hypothetical protein
MIRVIHVELLCTGKWCAWAVRKERPRFLAAYAEDRLEAVAELVDEVEPSLAPAVKIETRGYFGMKQGERCQSELKRERRSFAMRG